MKDNFAIRPELNKKIKRVVVKIGSAALADAKQGVNQTKIGQIVDDCHELQQQGIEVIIVSSGAIHIGKRIINQRAQEEITFLQACSAVGQPLLMSSYTQAFALHQRSCAQVLLTHEDMRNRQRFLNLKNTMNHLLAASVTPILNENDSVSFSEITLGDNDQLAAMVTQMIEADCLVILSTPDGLYDQDPSEGNALKIAKISYDERFEDVNLKGKTLAGRGGMKTKLEAVRKLTPLGIPVIIATYKKDAPILAAVTSTEGGTFFEGCPEQKKNAKQRWLVAIAKTGAAIKVDEGAYEAIKKNKSLLPSGIKAVEGQFRRGDCVKIVFKRKEFAIGLSEYSATELSKICGKKSQEIESVLGFCPAKVAIHCDNLVIKE
jgi:glutamate 5-kinase